MGKIKKGLKGLTGNRGCCGYLKIDRDHIVIESQKIEEVLLDGKWVLKKGNLWCQELLGDLCLCYSRAYFLNG